MCKIQNLQNTNYGMDLYFPEIFYHEIDFINIITTSNNN